MNLPPTLLLCIVGMAAQELLIGESLLKLDEGKHCRLQLVCIKAHTTTRAFNMKGPLSRSARRIRTRQLLFSCIDELNGYARTQGRVAVFFSVIAGRVRSR